MKLLDCPTIGVRPLQEFLFGGEVRPMPDPNSVTDEEWADYVFNRAGEPGVRKEWWYHMASGTWFIAERDNQKDIFIRSYLYGSEGERVVSRIPHHSSEWIDRTKPLTFRFEGREYTGFAGDSVTSALYANGVRVLGRSFKYHRPRGVYSLANHDSNVLMEDGEHVNLRGDITPLWDGADLRAVNTLGGVASDKGSIIDAMSKVLPVGFYYKAFHKPAKLFPFYERQMRKMAGLGSIDAATARVRTPKAYDFCDVLVIGGGPAGLSAAIAAAESGAKVVLVDECAHVGGTLTYQSATDDATANLLADLTKRAKALPNLIVRTGTQAVGYYADNWIALIDATRMTKMRATSVVVATGCYEQPAVFGNNDRPGVMLASAAQRLIHRYAVKPFERVIVLAANCDAYLAAIDLAESGVHIQAVVDLRADGEPSEAGARVRAARIPIYLGCTIVEALSNAGKTGIKGAVIQPIGPDGKPRERRGTTIEADGIAMSVGWASDWLLTQAGGKIRYSEELRQFLPQFLPEGMYAAGRVNGVFDREDQLADGARAGKAAAAGVPSDAQNAIARAVEPRSHAYPVFPHATAKSFVDLDEDVQYKDIAHSVQEGFEHVELLKRYSTFGMGPSQGKLTNVNVVRILAHLRGQTVAETGTTTSRPFVTPVALSHLAGRGFHPHRQTPVHHWHEEAGAVLMPAGEWERPAYYADPPSLKGAPPPETGGNRAKAIAAEVMAVRDHAGLIDVGTLGKLEINGPDAGEFIERMYTGRFAKMKIGTCRYGLMCDESGVVIDDGVVARLADDRYYVTTTTTASASVYREMQRWRIIWGLDVTLSNATGGSMAMNLAGPEARRILATVTDLDLSEKAFPYLGVREGVVCGAPAKMLRVGFVGELGYEIHVPATSGAGVWAALMAADNKIKPFGVEAQRVLRLEKGHAIISQDTDGMTTPFEADMSWAVKLDKPFFIGQRSLQIYDKRTAKRHLVGFRLAAGHTAPVVKECHLIIADGAIVGRITSIAESPTLGHLIGMAYLAPSMTSIGTEFQIRTDSGAMVTGTVVAMPFYDPEGARQK